MRFIASNLLIFVGNNLWLMRKGVQTREIKELGMMYLDFTVCGPDQWTPMDPIDTNANRRGCLIVGDTIEFINAPFPGAFWAGKIMSAGEEGFSGRRTARLSGSEREKQRTALLVR